MTKRFSFFYWCNLKPWRFLISFFIKTVIIEILVIILLLSIHRALLIVRLYAQDIVFLLFIFKSRDALDPHILFSLFINEIVIFNSEGWFVVSVFKISLR